MNTSELGLETVGLEPGKPVEVGSNLRSSRHDWLYAIGDANGRALLTHMGKYQGRARRRRDPRQERHGASPTARSRRA